MTESTEMVNNTYDGLMIMTHERPYVWEMIKEAVEQLGRRATYGQITDYINKKWQGVNKNTINAQIIVCTVNHPSRVHYPENSKTREANARYDFLYKIGRGEVVMYDPEKHGKWAIAEQNGRLIVTQENVLESQEELEETVAEPQSFALESHLRDFLAKHLDIVEKGMTLFRDESGRDGIEYQTETGPIDILAKDSQGNFILFELKVSRGADRAIGQLQRYMGWVRRNLAKNGDVRGVIVAQSVDKGLKYAALENTKIKLLEYELSFKVTPVDV